MLGGEKAHSLGREIARLIKNERDTPIRKERGRLGRRAKQKERLIRREGER